jgi:hypothetical protein
MSAYFEIYKQNKIKELNNEANNKLLNLNAQLKINITKVKQSNLLMANKQVAIDRLINAYNNTVRTINAKLRQDIHNINQLQPPTPIPNAPTPNAPAPAPTPNAPTPNVPNAPTPTLTPAPAPAPIQLQSTITQPQNPIVSVINNTRIKQNNALLIGINYLDNPKYKLNGCIFDVENMNKVLQTYGFTGFKKLTDVTDVKPTKTNILNELKNMLLNAYAGDVLFLFYSGHGTNIYDTNGDEKDGLDESIVSLDMQLILDDELKSIIKTYLRKDVTLIGLFDCCHSGTILDLKYVYLDSDNGENDSINNKVSECNGTVIMLSGCTDKQLSAESFINNGYKGVMTWAFNKCLNENKNCSWKTLLQTMRKTIRVNGYPQIPQLSTDSIYDINSVIFMQ